MNNKGVSTLEKFKKILKLKNYSKNTIKIYVHYVNEFIFSFNKSSLHITSKEINKYVMDYEYSSTSQQNQIYSALKLFSKYILNIKQINKIIPERPRKEKTLPIVIDKEYLLKKIKSIRNEKHKAIIQLGFSVGLRVSEVINIKICDIDSKRMIININNAKGHKDRIVPLSEATLKILRKYYLLYKPQTYLFNGQKSTKYSTTSCNNIVKKYLGKQYHFHQLRHSSFTCMLESGTDISIIQKIAGHTSYKTTMIYTQISNQLLKKAKLPI